MNICIIPARGGSKRIPRKNIKFFYGKPMISYSILAARKSELFTNIIVSTEDHEIANIAQKWGAEVPLLRPSDLADDYTATVPVISHAIRSCQKLGWEFDNVCCIYPCAPFIQQDDLMNAFELLKKSKESYVFPISEYASVIQRAFKRGNRDKLSPFYPEYQSMRTQDIETAYFDVGQFYWGTTNMWLKYPSIHDNGVGMVIPKWRSVDIDGPEDWQQAELFYQLLESQGKK